MTTDVDLQRDNHILFQVNTLGQFDVIKDGRSLVLAASGSKKIWELYKFMLTYRNRSFTPESLMDQLWVSEEYNDPRGTLRRQMHRLRQALDESESDDASKTLLFANGYYSWNDEIELELDTDLFEKYIKEADALKLKYPLKALEKYEAALELYIGDYLPECADQHWVFPVRNQYRRLYLKAVQSAIEIYKLKDDFESILNLCQKAIHIDIYEECFHVNLLEALLAKGEQRQAIDHYDYITGFYSREMGIKPSDEMRVIYKKILQTQSSIGSEESLYEALESTVTLENAFYCEPDVFKSVYELERRRSQRSGVSFSIGVLTALTIKGYTHSQKELRMNRLKQLLTERLRKGDTFTRWNDNQMVVMLSGVDEELTEKVLKRVLGMDKDNETIVINQITHLMPEPQNNRFIKEESNI